MKPGPRALTSAENDVAKRWLEPLREGFCGPAGRRGGVGHKEDLGRVVGVVGHAPIRASGAQRPEVVLLLQLWTVESGRENQDFRF